MQICERGKTEYPGGETASHPKKFREKSNRDSEERKMFPLTRKEGRGCKTRKET